MCPNLCICTSTLGSCMLTVGPSRLGKYQSTIDTGLPCNWIWMLLFPTGPQQTTETGVEQNPSFRPFLPLYWHVLSLTIQWSSEETEADWKLTLLLTAETPFSFFFFSFFFLEAVEFFSWGMWAGTKHSAWVIGTVTCIPHFINF